MQYRSLVHQPERAPEPLAILLHLPENSASLHRTPLRTRRICRCSDREVTNEESPTNIARRTLEPVCPAAIPVALPPTPEPRPAVRSDTVNMLRCNKNRAFDSGAFRSVTGACVRSRTDGYAACGWNHRTPSPYDLLHNRSDYTTLFGVASDDQTGQADHHHKNC